MFIPWGIVSMPRTSGPRRIGFYMERFVAHRDELWSWPALPDTVPRFISALQPLKLDGVEPKQQFSIFPFAAISEDRIDAEMDYRVGADFFWRPSTNLQRTATVNPDFGIAESILVLENRFWYYRIDSGTTGAILVLQKRFWHYRIDFGTSRFDFGTTQSRQTHL